MFVVFGFWSVFRVGRRGRRPVVRRWEVSTAREVVERARSLWAAGAASCSVVGRGGLRVLFSGRGVCGVGGRGSAVVSRLLVRLGRLFPRR